MRHKELKNNDSIGTVNFENCVFACEETVTISKSNHGAGKIEATIMLPEQELKNLLERCHNWSITEEQEEKGILGTVSLLVDVKIKNVSISILLDGNDNPSEYTEIPLKTKNVLSEESNFETVVFDKENIEYLSEDELLDIDERLKVNYDSYNVSEPNYYGTGNVSIQLTFTKDEISNLTSRSEDTISQKELDELFDFGNDCHYFANAKISAIDKKISVEISLYMANRNLSLEIPLKESEVHDIFDLMNSVVKDSEGKDLHDIIREIRKGAERELRERVLQIHSDRDEK